MTGILHIMMAGGAGVTTNTFNITAGTLGGSTLVGYGDGTAGTTGAGGSITGATLTGGKHIAEISTDPVTLNADRLRIKGLSANPGQNWLVQVIANGHAHTASGASYTWDSGNLCATWQWTPASFGFLSGNTYNGNTITHSP